MKFIAYTSLLRRFLHSASPMSTSRRRKCWLILASFTPLRNGWYSENYLASAPAALEHGVFIGAAGDGKIASATRADYAVAAARD